MIIKHGRDIFFWGGGNSRRAPSNMGFFLHCAFRILIGWAGKLLSRGSERGYKALLTTVSAGLGASVFQVSLVFIVSTSIFVLPFGTF